MPARLHSSFLLVPGAERSVCCDQAGRGARDDPRQPPVSALILSVHVEAAVPPGGCDSCFPGSAKPAWRFRKPRWASEASRG